MSNKTVKVSLTHNQIESIFRAFGDMEYNIRACVDEDDSQQLALYPRWMQDAKLSVERKLHKALKELGESK